MLILIVLEGSLSEYAPRLLGFLEGASEGLRVAKVGMWRNISTSRESLYFVGTEGPEL